MKARLYLALDVEVPDWSTLEQIRSRIQAILNRTGLHRVLSAGQVPLTGLELQPNCTVIGDITRA